MIIPVRRLVTTMLLAGAWGCGPRDVSPDRQLTVFAAGSLARPLREALDSIAVAGGPGVRMEIMGSRELLRSVIALRRTPDLIVTADADELERLLIPQYVTSATTFARNRVVLALSRRVAMTDTVTTANWADVVSSGSMRVARADPARAPLGYRTQMVWALAELELDRPGLVAKLRAASPPSLLRGNESDLAALLQSGDADAAWCYESLARALKLPYVRLGDRIDFGTEADSASYRRAWVAITGETPADSITIRGMPIRYAMAAMTTGPDPIGAAMLAARLLDSTSVRIMRRAGLDVLGTPRVVTSTARSTPAP